MNRNQHRIVFNSARGQLMAVGETASSHSRTSGSTRRGPRVRSMLLALGCALSLLIALPAQAQINAEPSAPGSLRPTVLTAPKRCSSAWKPNEPSSRKPSRP